jgi:5,10-methylenetetrahydromethanopterin reductase
MNRVKFGWMFIGKSGKQTLIEMVQACERSGFDIFWVADERFYMEVYSLLTLSSSHSKTIKLGPCVTDPYSRHPALTAMAIGTLDHFSGGRSCLGLGTGSSGFRQLGIKRKHPVIAVREAVHIIRSLLAGERVSYEGEIFRLQDCKLDFASRGQVPILIAANGPLMIRLAGEIGDGLMTSSMLAQSRIDEVMSGVGDGLAKSGRKRIDVEIWSRLNLAIHPRIEVAYRALKPIVYYFIAGRYPNFGIFERMGLKLPDGLLRAIEKVGFTMDSQEVAQVVELVPDEFVAKTCLAGEPVHIVKQLTRLMQAGIDGVTLYGVTCDGQKYMDLLGMMTSEVLPFFQRTEDHSIHP